MSNTVLYCVGVCRVKYGRTIFSMNLCIYLGYLLSLTVYVHSLDPQRETRFLHPDAHCPMNLTEDERRDDAYVHKVKEMIKNVGSFKREMN